MGRFVKGEVVVVLFPFSDLSKSKKRPAFVISETSDEDILMCQITSQNKSFLHCIKITTNDFKSGSLNHDSFVRTNKIFTLSKNLIKYKIGTLKDDKTAKVISDIVLVIQK